MKTTEEKDELNLITLAQQYSDDDKARELRALLHTPPPKSKKKKDK
jgi:hypothetical protein